MIMLIAVGLALLVVLAVVVGVVDHATASRRRYLAAERRDRWEARRAARL
jgi:hypothetical protein